MTYAEPGYSPPIYNQCRYDGSRLLFRGPRRELYGDFIACLGGTETFGKFIARPFPDLVEDSMGVTCVNFGWPNAGIEVFAGDSALIDCASRSRLTVLQVPGAMNMSNMYYRVHPRRNDRFLQATDVLCRLYPEVDFTDFSFTRHMVGRLLDVSRERFAHVRREISALWVTGMVGLVRRIDGPVVLLWLATRSPDCIDDCPDISADPAFVGRDMLEALRGDVEAIVELELGEEARGVDPGPGHSLGDRRAAKGVLGPEAHGAVADALVPVMADILQS